MNKYNPVYQITDWYDTEKIELYQYNKLIKLLNHAYDNIPYYKRIFDEYGVRLNAIKCIKDIEFIPILTKKDIINNFSDLIDKRPRIYKKTFKINTSGSTGNPLTIFKDINNKSIANSLYYRYLYNIGYRFRDKQIYLWARHKSGFTEEIKNKLKRHLYNIIEFNTYCINDIILYDIKKEIMKNNDIHIIGYSSAIAYLAKYCQHYIKSFPVKSVSITAESIPLSDKNIIKDVFGKNVYEYYGCGEVNSLAFECSYHIGLHHAFEHSILELLDSENKINNIGNVTITDLDNYLMPLIRYQNGDIARFSNQICPCGRKSKLIDRIEGRVYDFIKGVNGNIAHGGFFDDVLLDSGISEKYRLKDIQIIQTKYDTLSIFYVSNNSISEKDKNILSSLYQKFLGNMTIDYIHVEKLPIQYVEKKRFVISLSEYLKQKENGNFIIIKAQ